MSYRRAWLLIDAMNQMFRKPAVTTTLGGRGGGTAGVTPFGEEIITRYRAMEAATGRAIARHVAVARTPREDPICPTASEGERAPAPAYTNAVFAAHIAGSSAIPHPLIRIRIPIRIPIRDPDPDPIPHPGPNLRSRLPPGPPGHGGRAVN